MAKIDEAYHSLLNKILQEGYTYEDPNRKGVNRIEIPSYTFRHEFKDGFPAITTKKLHYKNVVTELIWFLRGDTNIKYLVDNGCNIWNKDAYNYYLKISKERGLVVIPFEDFIRDIKNNDLIRISDEYFLGDLGKVYGHYWRNSGSSIENEDASKDYDGFDQIKDIIDKMINNPMSSEIIVTARNPNDKDNQALPCCHYGFQIVMRPLNLDWRNPSICDGCRKKSSNLRYTVFENNTQSEDIYCEECYDGIKYGFELHWDQRSVDTFLG